MINNHVIFMLDHFNMITRLQHEYQLICDNII